MVPSTLLMMAVFTGLLEQVIVLKKHQLNYSSGYKLSEVTGIDVNSNGDVYVAGMVQKNKKEYTAYWKNGELVKWFRYEKK